MNVNQKIYRAIQKGLNEALVNLSIDDFSDVETITEEPNHEDITKVDIELEILAWKSKRLLIDKFVKKYEINESKEVEELKQFINSHPDVNVGIISANNKDHLKELTGHAMAFLGDNANLNWIDTSSITDMSWMFAQSVFNGDISNWDVSNVKNMAAMFHCAHQFDGDISQWDVSKVNDMGSMFAQSVFNGDISKWNVSNVTNMNAMFHCAHQFDGDISKWDVSNVTRMIGMFYDSMFNGDISKWDVSNVTNMQYMFYESQFNGDISNWDVSNVKNMKWMFRGSQFNGDISNWDVSNVTNMDSMFKESQFNGDISKWNVSSVIKHKCMFKDCPIKKANKPKFNNL